MRQDEIGCERDKRILDPNSAHTRPRGANSEKNSKKSQKIKKQLSSVIFSTKGMRQAEKGRTEFLPRIPLILDPREKITKKNSKKIKKQLSGVIFSQNGMRYAEKERKEFQTRIPLILNPWVKIPKKHSKKIQKTKINFPALFFAKTG